MTISSPEVVKISRNGKIHKGYSASNNGIKKR